MDDDLDGHNNLEEQALGTLPLDDTSGLMINGMLGDGTNNLIQWQSVGGRTYQVEYNEAPGFPAAGWLPLGIVSEDDVPVGLPDVESILDGSGATNARAYRVRLAP